MNNFGFDLDEFSNDRKRITELLGRYLNNGHLGLLLGAGVSVALNLPNWFSLVNNIYQDVFEKPLEDKNYSAAELKEIVDDIKNKISDQTIYLDKVKHYLYHGVEFDFTMAKKELLIALSSLIVGKNRGNVRNIITYNFDSVLEWYLNLLGLDVDTFTKAEFLTKSVDVVIAHIHGYLPFGNHGKNSKEIVFSGDEFVERLIASNEYWKEYFMEFFRRHTFLSIGMSAESVVKDVCPYLKEMQKWYRSNEIDRNMPYGISFLTPGERTDKFIPKLLEHGVIPLILPHTEIPTAIFEVVESALKTRK